MKKTNIIILGADGQLGKALKKQYPEARRTDSNKLDITNEKDLYAYDWSNIDIIINSAAYTNVDGAETTKGRSAAWAVNAKAVKDLVDIAQNHNITFIHISTDYVFDGTKEIHNEDEPFSPLSVYGASKASGDLLVSQLNKHYIIRTSWVIGEGKNFVRTMLDLGQKGINPTVVSDQIGRLTFTNELARAIDHLLSTKAPFGTYNVTNDGESVSWADITKKIYQIAGLNNTVTDISTANYYAGKKGIAPRPLQSTLNLSKIQATGFESINWTVDLNRYII